MSPEDLEALKTALREMGDLEGLAELEAAESDDGNERPTSELLEAMAEASETVESADSEVEELMALGVPEGSARYWVGSGGTAETYQEFMADSDARYLRMSGVEEGDDEEFDPEAPAF